MKTIQVRKSTLGNMVTYSLGECSNSLITNSLFGFAMLYYTDALGLAHSLAGLAMFIAIFWDAASDPIMGHITDNTRSKFGRRHPYMLIGGLAMVAIFYFLWDVPDYFKTTQTILFWYLVVMNLLLRTAFTIFVVPYIALGFEICTDYNGRAKLQGIRNALSMAANLCGPALAWAIFFQNKGDVKAITVAENFINMGTIFAIAALMFILIVVFSTAKYIKDSRQMKITGTSLKDFFVDMKEIITDKYPRWVFAFTFVVILGIALVSSLQMYLYEHFMKFGGTQKSIAHGGTMVGMGLGGLFAFLLVKRFDKKGAIYIGCCWSVFCNAVLAILFLTGILKPGQTIQLATHNIPIAFIAFAFFHGAYWFGNGIMIPIATSMMADVSEIHEIKTGINKDGGYSAVLSFALKCAISISTLVSGFSLSMIGFKEGIGQVQTPQAVWRLCVITLLAGPAISVTALALIRKYPVNEAFVNNIRENQNNENI